MATKKEIGFRTLKKHCHHNKNMGKYCIYRLNVLDDRDDPGHPCTAKRCPIWERLFSHEDFPCGRQQMSGIQMGG